MPRIRQATADDIPHLLELQHACYPVLSTIAAWSARHLQSHQRVFPEGQFVAETAGRVVGHCATFRTTAKAALAPHTFRGITHRGTFAGHVPDGDTLYGAEIMVHPDQRGRGVAKRFYEARFGLMQQLGIRRFVAGGRIPGYERHADAMTAQEYVEEVVAGRLHDRVLSVQLRSGLRVVGVLEGYLNDPRSRDHATLLTWAPPRRAARSDRRPGTRKRPATRSRR